VFAVELKTAFSPRRGGLPVFVRTDMMAALIERRQTIECLELEGLVDRQPIRTRRPCLSTKTRRGEWYLRSVMPRFFAGDPRADQNIKVAAVGPGEDGNADHNQKQNYKPAHETAPNQDAA
jgi:hypothetical protein